MLILSQVLQFPPDAIARLTHSGSLVDNQERKGGKEDEILVGFCNAEAPPMPLTPNLYCFRGPNTTIYEREHV